MLFWYSHTFQEDDFDPVDNCLTSVLGQEIELTDEFKANYNIWLQKEVYNTQIQWELLLVNPEEGQPKFGMTAWKVLDVKEE